MTLVLQTTSGGPRFKDAHQTRIYQARVFTEFKLYYIVLPLVITEKVTGDSDVLWKQRSCTFIVVSVVVTC